MNLLAVDLGKITPPAGVLPDTGGDPTNFVAGIVRGGVMLMVIVAFITALIWTIFAGYRFITAGSDEKAVSSAWSQIYWGLLGLVIVVGAFAIINLVETFFDIKIISDFTFPTR